MYFQYPEQNKKPRIWKVILLVFIVLALITVSFGAGLYFSARSSAIRNLSQKEFDYLGRVFNLNTPQPEKLSNDVDFNLFWEVWNALKNDYVDKNDLTDKKLFYGAIRGLVDAVGDPYTVFMDPKETMDFQADLAGTFEGIGAEIGIKKDTLIIIAPLAGSPAEKAGLKAGDKIYAIDGVPTSGIAVNEAVANIRGPKGTKVKLTISRDGLEKARDVEIVRDTIVVKSVKSEAKDDIYTITVSNFNDDTAAAFQEAVNDVLVKNPKGVILDLRDNPGGYLDTAIDVASFWVESGVVVTEKFSDDKKNDYLARGRAKLKEYKTVVLVNEGSASASEIVAGALQDYGLATLIGQKTFGKGSVQTLDEFSDGSTVKVTVAKWFTPKGNNISEKGITPDIAIELTPDDYENDKDPQMEAAVKFLRGEKVESNVKATSTPEK